MSPVADAFADDYAGARTRFLAAAERAGARLLSWPHPLRGPDDGVLATDVALLGPPDAERLLLANSATHGVEGFCGSGTMTTWLQSDARAQIDGRVGVILIHAINPHGFAWLRRVNEDNVDLNRNFIDHSPEPDPDPEFSALMPVLLPEAWNADSERRFQAVWQDLVAERGLVGAQAVLSRGQYVEPGGVFFGGRAPVWSNRTFREIVARHAGHARRLAFIDFHTGLGPFAHGELIHRAAPGSAARRRLESWIGHGLTSPTDSSTTSAARSDGLIENALRQTLPDTEITALTAEFGTYPMEQVLSALRADNWLHQRGTLDSDVGRAIKATMRERFAPAHPDWRELVALRARQLFGHLLAGLAGED